MINLLDTIRRLPLTTGFARGALALPAGALVGTSLYAMDAAGLAK